MRAIRVAAVVVIAATVGGSLTGCRAGGWCSPLEPSPSVTATFQSTADAIVSVPGVRTVSPRYYQPDDRHCVSRDYLETAAWAATYEVRVAAGITDAQVAQVRAALGTSTATMKSAPDLGVAEWWIYLGAPPSTLLSPAPTDSLSSDSQRIALVKEAARLPDVTTAQLLDSSMTIRVQHAESVVGAVTWLRGEPALGSTWVYVGDSAAWSVAIDVSDGQGVSDQTVAAIATFVQAHPRIELTVTSYLVSGVVPTKAEARELLAVLQRTEADSSNQKVLLWWPDGNGTKVSGQVGSALGTH